MNMTRRTKAILALGGVFLIGALCGALAIGALIRSEVRSAHRLRDRGGFSEYFAEQLELTRTQRDSLQGELDWFYAQFAGLRTAAEGEFHDLLDSLDRRLVSHLSPEQIERLRRTEQKLRKPLANRRSRPFSALPPDDGVDDPIARDTARTPASVAAPGKPAADAASRSSVASSSAAAPDTTARADSTQPPDTGPAFTRFGDRLKQQLALSDTQVSQIRRIVGATRKEIRREFRALHGFPRLQLEAAAAHLRRMDREILLVLDDRQRAAYEPMRDDIAASIRAQLVRHLSEGRGGRGRRGLKQQRGTAPRQ